MEHDFTRGAWWPDQTVDAVWCVEFSEHVQRQVRVCEERSDELKGRVDGISSLRGDTYVRSVAAAGFDTNSNVNKHLLPCDSLRSS